MKGKVFKILLSFFAVAVVFGLTVFIITNQDSKIEKTAYDAWLNEGNKGTEAEFLAWIKKASNWDIAGQKTPNSVVPETPKQKEDPAYDAWLNEGNKGTEAEFLAWLDSALNDREENRDITLSEPAPTSRNAAYDYWLSKGNKGAETDFSNWVRHTLNSPINTTSPKCPECPKCPEKDQEPVAWKNVKFDSINVPFDGSTHEVKATGVPNGVDIHYANNTAIDMGVHRAFVRLYREDLGEKLMSATITIGKIDIADIAFEDATYTYNGQTRNIYVKGDIPEGVEVKYTLGNKVFNGASQAGTYEVTATLTGGNYNDLVLTATLIINKANLDNVSIMFYDKTFEYNGAAQRIDAFAVTGLPTGVVINYTFADAAGDPVDAAIIPGAYTTKAILSSPNHNSYEYAAKLTITKGNIKNVTLPDLSVIHDGSTYDIKIVGSVPSEVTVKYTQDKEGGSDWTAKSENGVYTIVATLTGQYYNKLVLTAKLSITNDRLSQATGIAFSGKGTNKTMVLNWDPVPNAGSYDIYLSEKNGTPVATAHVDKGTSYEIQKMLFDTVLRDIYNLEIVAVPKGGDANWGPSLPSEAVDYYHEGVFKPVENVRLEDGVVKWDVARFAEGYLLKLSWYGTDGKFVENLYSEIQDGKADNMDMVKLAKDAKLKPGTYKISVSASVLVPWVTGGFIYGDGFSSTPVYAGTFTVN